MYRSNKETFTKLLLRYQLASFNAPIFMNKSLTPTQIYLYSLSMCTVHTIRDTICSINPINIRLLVLVPVRQDGSNLR